MSNNLYLYNLIFNSEFCNYTPECSCILGMEPSLALYLFSYSKNLFFSYPRSFTKNSLVINNYKFFNTWIYLSKTHPQVSKFSFNYKNINFRYLQDYAVNIRYIDHVNKYDKVYLNNPPEFLEYNGIGYYLPKVEDVIGYCLYLYSKSFNLNYLADACVIGSIYINRIVQNNILTNLLIAGCNIKKIFSKALRDFNKLKFLDMDFEISQNIIEQRMQPILNFCYDS